MRYFLLFFLITINFPLFGQQNDLFTDLFTGYFYNLGTINPAYSPKDIKSNFIASYKNRLGPFSKIITYSFTAEKVFQKANQSAHIGRIVLWNEQEGPYIHKPRAYANYAYSLPVGEDMHISAGIALGFAQVAFSAPTASGAGSALYPDGSLGLMLKSNNFNFGISSMQIFNSGQRVINAPFRLRRFYNFFLSAKKDISPVWTIKGYFLCRLLPSIKNNINISPVFTYRDLFSFGSSVSSKGTLALFISFNAHLGNNRILFNFVYNSSLSSKNMLQDSFELTTAYNTSGNNYISPLEE